MSGETDLAALLRSMKAKLAPETYVFVTQKNGGYTGWGTAAEGL